MTLPAVHRHQLPPVDSTLPTVAPEAPDDLPDPTKEPLAVPDPVNLDEPQPCRNVAKRQIQRRTRNGLRQCMGCRLTYTDFTDPDPDPDPADGPAILTPGTMQILLERQGHRRDVMNLWLKSVGGVDLAVHCEHALTGRGAHLERAARRQMATVGGAPVHYLCAVTRVHEDNVHLMLFPDPAATALQVVNFPIMRVTVGSGLRPEQVTAADFEDHYNGHSEYSTCRNLQAAWTLYKRHAFPNDSRRSGDLQTRQAQLSQRQRVKEGGRR